MRVALSSDNKHLILAFGYSPTLIAQVKQLEGRTWDKSARVWRIPLASASHALPRLRALGFTVDSDIDDLVATTEVHCTQLKLLAQRTTSEFATSLPLY